MRTKSGFCLEEVEAGGDDPVDLAPPLPGVVTLGGDLDPTEPLEERGGEDLLVDGLLRREVVQHARTADPDRFGDVVQGRAGVALLGEAMPRLERIASRVVVVPAPWPRAQGTGPAPDRPGTGPSRER
jgi:hypothetical protein